MSAHRHFVDIKRPATTLDANGLKEKDSDPGTLIESWPCTIEGLSGLEQIRARKMFAEATHRVKGYQDPVKPILVTDYVLFGTRKLYIGHISDPDEKGFEYELLVAEEV